MLRKLRPNDVGLIGAVLPPAKIPEFIETYLSDLRTWHSFGLFDDTTGELKGISCAYYSGELPEWCLLQQYCDDERDLTEIIDRVCKVFEGFKLYKFNWIDYDYSIDFLKNFIPKRYITVKEYETAPWLKTKFTKHYGSLYNSQWSPVKSTVYLSVLPEELRK